MTTTDSNLDASDLSIPGRLGNPIPMRTLIHHRSQEMETHLIASPDRMRACLKIVPGPAYQRIDADVIIDFLTAGDVVAGYDRATLEFFAAMQNSPTPFGGFFQLARGEPMHKGEDGYIEFHVQPSAGAPRYDQTDAGNIDFKQLNLLENCFAGQRVATVIPPGPGKDGFDVFGQPVPAQPGEPLRVMPGPGVILSASGRDFTSEIEGRLVYEKNVLSVSPVVEINQDIDYGVGNIDFIGKVVINGSVLDGFSVKGKSGVEISGDVGSATIISDGDVVIRGGIQGREAARIECYALQARYIDKATVEAKGDVTADKEILHSSVKSLGRVLIERGSIVGGEVWGLQGVVAENIGSEMGVVTTVVAGLSWTDENVIAGVRGKIAEYTERVAASQLLLEPLLETPNMAAKLTLDQKSMISDLVGELRTLRDHLSDLIEEKDNIVNRRQDTRICQINVVKNLYMGVEVRFTIAEGAIKDAVKGPLSIVQENKGFRLTGMTPLAVPQPTRTDDEEEK